MSKKVEKQVEVKEKRKRGRPRKNTVDIQESLNQGISKIDELQSVLIEKLETSEIVQEFPKTTEGLTNWCNSLGSQIDQLTKKIEEVKKELKKAEARYNQLEALTNEITQERSLIKALNEKDQDRIYKAENKMLKIDPSAYRADIPDFLRPLIKFLTGKEDEILLRGKIAQSEAKISQRQTRLVEVNDNLSYVLIAHKYYSEGIAAFKGFNEDYRAIRMNLGKIRREIQENLKNRKNEADQNMIVQTYIETMAKLNNAGSHFSNSLSKAKNEVTELFDKVVESQRFQPGKLYSMDLDQNLDAIVDRLSKLEDISKVGDLLEKNKVEKNKEKKDKNN